MKRMLALAKEHMISLLSGLAAIIFLVIGALGMTSSAVEERMQEQAAQAQPLSSLRNTAKNQAWIDAEAERARNFEAQYERTLQIAERINKREPLMTGVFPALENPAAAFEFAEIYRRAVEQLPRGELHGGGPPSPRDIQEATEDINEMLAQLQEEMGAASGTAIAAGPSPTAPPIAGTNAPIAGVPPIAGMGAPQIAGMGRSQAAARSSIGVDRYIDTGKTLGDPKTDPFARAAVINARDTRCYASVDPAAGSFHISPIWSGDVVPKPEEMWYAQVGLWIQQDIVDALAAMNEEAAKQLPEDERWVAHLPVKRLQSVTVHGYLTKSGPVPFSSVRSSAAMQFPPSFTQRKSDEQFDVVRFTVVAVVDQRQVTQLIDAITRQNFYKPISCELSAVTPADPDQSEGYLYGADPVVRVTLDFEGYMARSVYETLFPREVREKLGISEKR